MCVYLHLVEFNAYTLQEGSVDGSAASNVHNHRMQSALTSHQLHALWCVCACVRACKMSLYTAAFMERFHGAVSMYFPKRELPNTSPHVFWSLDLHCGSGVSCKKWRFCIPRSCSCSSNQKVICQHPAEFGISLRSLKIALMYAH